MTLLELMFTFFYIGLFTIGGGLVAITLMYEPIVGNGLITSEQFYNMVAISESTPGPIGINMATYIGYELYGVVGGIATTAATVLPSLIIIIIIAKFFMKFQRQKITQVAFATLRATTSGMILVAAMQIFVIAVLDTKTFLENKKVLSLFKFPEILFYCTSLLVLCKTKISPIYIILLGAIFGMIFL